MKKASPQTGKNILLSIIFTRLNRSRSPEFSNEIRIIEIEKQNIVGYTNRVSSYLMYFSS